MNKKQVAKKMCIPVKEMVSEHKRLVKNIKEGKLKGELKKQEKELKQYERK